MSIAHSDASHLHTQPGSAKTVADILTAAAEIVAKPGAWTQGTFARDGNGRHTGWRDDDAKCFCVAGAISRAGGTSLAHLNPAWDIFNEWTVKRGFRHLAHWNDSIERTQAEVVAALRAAAAKAAEAGQ